MVGKPNNPRVLVALLLAAALMFVCAPRAVAQVVNGTFVGTVVDTQGGAIPNASVSATNRETGVVRPAVSQAAGEFTVTNVPAGTYDITVTVSGFRQEVRNSITMTVGATVRVDFKLTVGDVTQKVQVTEEAPQVDTTTSTLSGLVSDTAIRQLPLNGRDWLQLAALQAGVLVGLSKNPDPGENVTHGGGMFLTVSGGRPTSNVFLVDGLVINDEANKSPGSTVDGVNLGVDAIREFSVLTSTFSAEYGRSSGGVVNAITKSGTNDIHGTAFGFLRNSALDASNFFTGRVPFHREQFGGALGGPIKKDKLFYFADYEGLRQLLAESQPTFTISNEARAGTIPGEAPISINTQPYLALFPKPTGPALTTDPYMAPLSFPGGTNGTEDYVIGRIDYVPSTKTTIHGTYNFDRSITSAPDGEGLKTIGSVQRDQRVTLSWQYSFSSTVINTVNTGFSRVVGTGNIDVPGSATSPAYTNTALGFFPNQNPGTIILNDLSPDGVRGVPGGVGATGGDQIWWTDPQLNDNLAWVKGRNDIRMGFSVEALQDNLSVGRYPLGDWEFDTVQNFLADIPSAFNASLLGPQAAYRHTREKIFGVYIQDDARVRSNLTLNFGVRYEPTTTFNILNGLASTFSSLTAPTVTTGNPIFHNPTLHNFTPRIGLAWDPTGSGKTAIRAAFGMFNIIPLPNLLSGNVNHAIPFFPLAAVANPAPGGPLNALPSGPSSLTGYYIQQNPPEAYKLQWNLDIQRQLRNGLSVTAAYVGARGVHLPDRYGDVNLVPPSLLTTAPDGHLAFPSGSPVINTANPKLVIPATLWNSDSFYHSLQINVVQQLAHGLSFQAVYALAKSLDEGSSEVNGTDNYNTIENPYPFDPRLQRAVSDWDVPQHLTLNFDWLAPSPHVGNVVPRFLVSGWELGGIYTIQSGMPFSVQITGDRAGTGTHVGGKTGQRPNLVPSCSPDAVDPGNVVNYIIQGCFTFPAAGELGDVGRNTLRSPGMQDFDFSLFKNHNVGERLKIQFRAEFFNLFNLTAFAPHTETIFTKSGGALTSNDALIGPTAIDQREIQFGLKATF